MASEKTATLAKTELHQVPLTIEGSAVLHQMFRVRWSAWHELRAEERRAMVDEASLLLEDLEREGLSAMFSVLGHKGDLMFIHFRDSFEEVNSAELRLANLKLNAYLEPTASYVSMVELGLYDSSLKTYRALAEQGVERHSEQWNQAMEETMERSRQAMKPRLYPKIPETRYVCFYPMDRRRGETKNWYVLPIEDRQRQMDEHGTVGRRYAGKVQQIISGSIGFDDWEWGVDLFSNDATIFKKLIYEMRFDEVSAVFSNFGTFYLGIRVPAAKLGELMTGTLPANGR